MDLFKKFVEFAMGNGIVLVLGFVSSPIITRIISPLEMGKFSMFNTWINLLLLVVLLGLDQSYVRFYYDESLDGRRKLLIKCTGITFVTSTVLIIFLLLFYKQISFYIVDEVSFIVIILVIIHLLFSILSRFSLLNIRMKQRAKLYSFINVVLKVAYLIGVFIFFNFYKDNYMTLVLATVISNILVAILSVLLEKEDWLIFNKKINMNVSTKEIIHYGLPFIFSMSITWLFQSIDRISIKEFCGYGEVGIYSGAMNIIVLLIACQGAFTTFWAPVAFERYSKNPEDTDFFKKMNEIVSVVMIFITIGLIAGKDIIVLFLGEKYRTAAFIFPFLTFMPIMHTISETTVLGINFKKKTNKHILIAIICAITNVVGNLILVPRFGATGAAISTGISYMVFFGVRTYISQKYYKVGYDIKKFSICILATYVLATYSSFYKFNFVILLLSILCLVILFFSYKNIFFDGFKMLKNRL